MPLDKENFKRYQQEYHIKNKERRKVLARKNHLKRYFNFTEEDYVNLLNKQNGGCAICGIQNFGDKRMSYFSIDHSHDNGKVRGLLCASCNRGLGYFKDNPQFLLNAFNYLNKTK